MVTTLVILTALSFSESAGPAPAETITLPETVITATATKTMTKRRTGNVWVCEGEWHASQIGGSYKRCEYVQPGHEPKGF